jgi:uncharacterized protein (TIGR02001 family)
MTQELIMNAIKLTALATLMAVGVSAQAADVITIPDVTTSGSVAATTDYMYRGVSQTGNDPAIQGNIMLAHSSGVYANVWGSSVAGAINKSGSEMDFSVGYSTELTGALKPKLDVGVMRYAYAGSGKPRVDFNEVYGSLTFASFLMKDDSFKGSVALTDDFFNQSGKYIYVAADYSVPVMDTGLTALAHLGYNKFDSGVKLTKALGADQGSDDDYVDYKFGVAAGVQGMTADVSYIGSDISDSDCGSTICEGRFVVSLTKAF